MPIAFNAIPATARVPGTLVEIDDSLAGITVPGRDVILYGQKLGGGTVCDWKPRRVLGDIDAKFGRGSHLADMIRAFRAANPSANLWALALPDNEAGQAARLSLTFTGTAAANATVTVEIGGTRLQLGIASGEDSGTVAAALGDIINAADRLPVTAAVPEGNPDQLDISCRHKGESGNDIQVTLAGLPDGLTVAGAGWLAGGSGNPDLAPAMAGIADQAFAFHGLPYTDTASLNVMSAELESRWGPLRALYGQAFAARRGSPSELLSFADSRNDRFISVLEASASPGPAWRRMARYLAMASLALTNHPARPLQTLPLAGEAGPAVEDRLTWAERNQMLQGGIATTTTDAGGVVRIGRAVSLWRRNASGDPDITWLDVTTAATVAAIAEDMQAEIDRVFIRRRCILVNDGTPVGAGIPYATPRKVRAYLVGRYDTYQEWGWVENAEMFKQLLVVERNPTDPTRLDVRHTPDLANPLAVIAAQIGFSLQWSVEAAGAPA